MRSRFERVLDRLAVVAGLGGCGGGTQAETSTSTTNPSSTASEGTSTGGAAGTGGHGAGNGGASGSGGAVSTGCIVSANDTVVTTPGPTLCDSAGNVWAITPAKTLSMNGVYVQYSANVVEIAYVDGTIWQENASDLWWAYEGGSWTPTNGTSTSPLTSGAGGGGSGGGGAGSGAPLVQTPLPGNVSTGSWQSGQINGMGYQYLLPEGYSTANAYPLILYLHQLDNESQIPSQIDPWFNDVAFRTNYPSIVIAPQCDQSADPSGQTINWGGVSSGDQPCQDNAMTLVRSFMIGYSVYAKKVYVTGNSMGGIGSWDLIIKYNTKSPTIAPIFAATLILAGATYDWGYPDPNQSVVSALHDVPIWAIHGGQDTTVPLAWDQSMIAAEQAAGGKMQLIVDPNLGHDVWDTYYVIPQSETYWSWLFSQSY